MAGAGGGGGSRHGVPGGGLDGEIPGTKVINNVENYTVLGLTCVLHYFTKSPCPSIDMGRCRAEQYIVSSVSGRIAINSTSSSCLELLALHSFELSTSARCSLLFCVILLKK